MGSRVISFRLDDDKLALLQQQRVRGESDNQTAMRLLMDVLGVEVKQSSRHAVDIVDNIRIEIKESIADGDIKEAIASSYAGIMGQFNGLQDEVRELQNQLQELQLTPPAVPCSLLPVTNDQLPIPNDQLPMINEQIPELNKSQVQNIRTTLKRKNITASAEQIRKAFMDAGWDGDNWEESRNKAIEILIIPLSEYN